MTRVRLFSEPGSEAQTFLQFRQQASKSSAASSQPFQVAESMGFKGDFRQWEHLLLIGYLHRKNRAASRQCRPTGPDSSLI